MSAAVRASAPTVGPVPSEVPVATPSAGAASSASEPPKAEPKASAARSSHGVARPAGSEAELLESARNALATSPARAFSLAEQHRTLFPGGVLAQEREVIAIEALKRLGRTDEATRRAADFARRYPGSAYRKKLDSGSP